MFHDEAYRIAAVSIVFFICALVFIAIIRSDLPPKHGR